MRRLGYLTRSPSIALHMRTGPALKHFAEHAARCARSARAPVSEWIAAQVALVRAQTSAPAQAGSCGALGCEPINLQRSMSAPLLFRINASGPSPPLAVRDPLVA